MITRYILHFDGQKIESASERELRRIAANTDCYWEIWKHVIPAIKNECANQKVTLLDIREMLSMFESGDNIKTIAKTFKITPAWAKSIIQKEKIRQIQHSLNV